MGLIRRGRRRLRWRWRGVGGERGVCVCVNVCMNVLCELTLAKEGGSGVQLVGAYPNTRVNVTAAIVRTGRWGWEWCVCGGGVGVGG